MVLSPIFSYPLINLTKTCRWIYFLYENRLKRKNVGQKGGNRLQIGCITTMHNTEQKQDVKSRSIGRFKNPSLLVYHLSRTLSSSLFLSLSLSLSLSFTEPREKSPSRELSITRCQRRRIASSIATFQYTCSLVIIPVFVGRRLTHHRLNSLRFSALHFSRVYT